MNDAEIDRVLSQKDDILPSSGFATSVMDAVRAEADAPPPIPFPWKRALPAIVLAAAALLLVMGLGITAIAHTGSPSSVAGVSRLKMPDIIGSGPGGVAGWTALSLVIALVTAKLSMRLAGARS